MAAEERIAQSFREAGLERPNPRLADNMCDVSGQRTTLTRDARLFKCPATILIAIISPMPPLEAARGNYRAKGRMFALFNAGNMLHSSPAQVGFMFFKKISVFRGARGIGAANTPTGGFRLAHTSSPHHMILACGVYHG